MAILLTGGGGQLRVVLGTHERPGVVPAGEGNLQAFALWAMDKLAKAYLRVCWRLRGAMMGELRVVHGVLKCDPSGHSVASSPV